MFAFKGSILIFKKKLNVFFIWPKLLLRIPIHIKNKSYSIHVLHANTKIANPYQY